MQLGLGLRLRGRLRKNTNSLRSKKRRRRMKQSNKGEKKDVMLDVEEDTEILDAEEICDDTEILDAQEIPDDMVVQLEVSKDKKMKGIVEGCSKLEDMPKYDLSNSKNLYGGASSAGCDVCMAVFSISDFIRSPCNHRFCKDCIETYLLKEIQEDATHVVCPESKCKNVLKPEFCCKLIPEQVFDRWKSELNLASSFGRRKIQCPNPDCLKEFMDDGKGYNIRACPKCCNLICMPCGRVEWHMEEDCGAFWRRKHCFQYGQYGRQYGTRRAGFGRKLEYHLGKYGSNIGRFFEDDDPPEFYQYP
ncbi:hypothetical protein POM88_051625 [Heracleum sosnowskyi]|uniref:Uncharacterized protein n=1 Tax=Heracleum sosnowskyi TaxID=360622 RepID=A0AAD8M3L1_9APIA|nr:hypothetical protein POM88_051625 [Heracleum sosnowskyi]